jgi:hypothetical protein
VPVSRHLAAIAAVFVSIAALVSVGGSACARDASGAGDGAPAASAVPAAASAAEAKPAPKPAQPKPLAEAANPNLPVVVQVLETRRASADTVSIAFAATNTSTGEKAVPVAPIKDAKPADFYLITADGARRLFLLRDAQNNPVLDGDIEQPLKPGERRLFQALFPAPPASAAAGADQPPVRVTLVVGPYVLRELPIGATVLPSPAR